MPSISEEYSIKYADEIGRGASGRVYAASRKADGLTTAVKTSLDKELLKSITQEIKTLKALDHPHIVKLYDIYEETRHFFIVMELIKGGELFDRISKKLFYSEKDAQDLCRIVLGAIKHCHDLNIVHRDLKPENLLMARDDDDANVKLVDFGFAEEAPNDSHLTGQMGTPMYMAPEIWSGIPYGKPIDMWSFGVITYILLAGYPPFSDDKRERLVARIKSGVFVFHDQYWSNVSEQAKDFINKLLVVNPAERLTVDQALNHPWLVTSDLESRDLRPALVNLKDFNAKRRLRGAVQAVVAIKRMNKIFNITNIANAAKRAEAENNNVENEKVNGKEELSKTLSTLVRQYRSELENNLNEKKEDLVIADMKSQLSELILLNEKLSVEVREGEEILKNYLISEELSESEKARLEKEKEVIKEKVLSVKKEMDAGIKTIKRLREIV